MVSLFKLEEFAAAGMPVFDLGDPGDKFYILLHGRLQVPHPCISSLPLYLFSAPRICTSALHLCSAPLQVFNGEVQLAVLDGGSGSGSDRHGLNGTQGGYPFFGVLARF